LEKENNGELEDNERKGKERQKERTKVTERKQYELKEKLNMWNERKNLKQENVKWNVIK
jgi:hypothetical protein